MFIDNTTDPHRRFSCRMRGINTHCRKLKESSQQKQFVMLHIVLGWEQVLIGMQKLKESSQQKTVRDASYSIWWGTALTLMRNPHPADKT